MQLKPEVAAALERLRENNHINNASSVIEGVQDQQSDSWIVVHAILDLYPPDHDDEITPDGLIGVTR